MLSVQFFTFNAFQENTYIIYAANGEAIIVDPGCNSTVENNALLHFVTQHNLRVVQLINTHCHLDHILGNDLIASTYGLELFLHPNEEQMLLLSPQAAKMYGIQLTAYKGALHFLKGGDVVTLGGETLQVLDAPGHSPGSICLYSQADRFIIAGDVLFKESVGRTDLPGGNHQALLTSIREQLFTLPEEVVVYPGHGPTTTIGHEKKYNPFLQNN
ncbi:MAG: MBL fold metallo-hydrolase [Chitinophagaceae bacterium]|nr:MBL fold metallo-hydrolase [Chitinophagaceae bacterium]